MTCDLLIILNKTNFLFVKALEHSQSSSVAYEIVLSVQRLVHKYGKEQQMVTWDIILDLIDALLRHIEVNYPLPLLGLVF